MVVRTGLGHILPSSVRWRRSKNGFATPQAQWLGTTLRPLISGWAAKPSPRIREIADVDQLRSLSDRVLQRQAHPMDGGQLLLMRLFLLDKWLDRFDVAMPTRRLQLVPAAEPLPYNRATA
jgi:hypothetical protein